MVTAGANSITENNKRTLYDLVAKFSKKDFRAANPTGRRNSKGDFRPYRLGADAEEALGYYTLSLQDDLTMEQIGNIKAYLLLQRKYGNID